MSQRPPFWHPSTLIATCFGLGYAPKAPGTVGAGATALVLLELSFWSPSTGNNAWLWVALASPFVYIAGVWASRKYMSAIEAHDPGAIIIDEVIGMMVAWLVAVFSAWVVIMIYGVTMGALVGLGGYSETQLEVFSRPPWLTAPVTITVGAFLLFRLFDIWKPWPVGRIDRDLDGPHGVMLDDVAAGLMAGVTWFFFTIAVLIVWLTLVWAQPDTGWQESHGHPDSTFRAGQHNER